MFSSLKGWEIPAILIIVLLLFGGKKLPEAARGLGRSLRILERNLSSSMRSIGLVRDFMCYLVRIDAPAHHRTVIRCMLSRVA